MDLGIAGRKAIVCASSRGLGRGCALALAEAGCDLVINGRDAAVLEREAEAIAGRFGVRVTPIAGDVSQPAVQRALVAAAPEADILVNNNSGPPLRAFEDLDREKIIEGLVQNMVTPLELVALVLPGMRRRRFGRIVNITSFSVKMPIPGLDLSSGARAGLTGFLAGVCRTVADRNVTINNLLPGRMDTDRLRAAHRHAAESSAEPLEAVKSGQAREVPAGRFGTPEEFGQVCAFLCSVHAGYMTGQNILVDGGLFPARSDWRSRQRAFSCERAHYLRRRDNEAAAVWPEGPREAGHPRQGRRDP